MAFETTTEVRFAHVDAAGIVFYPRCFEMLNAAVEDWCADELGVDFRTMHADRRIGVPTVKLSVEFASPGMLGERLTISLHIRHVGRSSCQLGFAFAGDGRERLKGELVLVCMDIEGKKAVPWPDDMRARMTEGLVPTL